MNGIFSIQNKVALVTGGTSGIGYMIAQGLVKHGAKVYVASRKADACQKTAQELSAFGTCIGIPADLYIARARPEDEPFAIEVARTHMQVQTKPVQKRLVEYRVLQVKDDRVSHP